MRAEVADVDFTSNAVLIREKKRSKAQRPTRVPLTPFLKDVLQAWLAVHPGRSGPVLPCGCRRPQHKAESHHRLPEVPNPHIAATPPMTITKRQPPAPAGLTPNEIHDHVKRVLAGTLWAKMRGLHCLRHSFISACASKGVDQRLVQEWAGHMNEATSNRYRHLYPSTQQEAISRVFE